MHVFPHNQSEVCKICKKEKRQFQPVQLRLEVETKRVQLEKLHQKGKADEIELKALG